MKKEKIIDLVIFFIGLGLIKLTYLCMGFEDTVLITLAFIIDNQIKGGDK